MKKIGLIINPVAGMGGKVGLKGTDGEEVYNKAITLGAVMESPLKAKRALKELLPIKDSVEIITFKGVMGEDIALELGFNTRVIEDESFKEETHNNIEEHEEIKNERTYITTSEDTIRGARALIEEGVDLIIFAGGDGTARNIYEAVELKGVVLGIPSGVKIHSPVYAKSPVKAGEMARKFLEDNRKNHLKEVEVMDIDEDSFRKGQVRTRLYGYLKVPYDKQYMQNLKCGSSMKEDGIKKSIAKYIVDTMEEDTYYIVGPGSTTKFIMEELSLDGTLLGVDVIYNKRIVKLDGSEKGILSIIRGKKSKIIITPIGGQGHIFGRGNQQLSPRIIGEAGKDNIIIIATKEKITELKGSPLLVDTGYEVMDKYLSGYVKVITGYKDMVMYKVEY